MLNPFQPNLRKPWLLLCISILLVYTIMPVTQQTFFFHDGTSGPLELFMFLLAFPLGDLLMFFFFHSYHHGIMERFVFWALAMGVGYVQWFHLFPALLRRTTNPVQPVITLNLANAVGVARPPEAQVPRAGAVTRPALPARKPDDPPVPQFDERGRTPLERVLRDEG